jgi:outer membrane protein assembly factor BamE
MNKSLICSLMLLLLTSCSIISKPQIEQGNIITPEMISQLHPGMTPPQVIDVMGSPVLANILTPNRLEYVYTFQNTSGKRTESRVSCLFQNGRLKAIQRG